MSSHGLALVLNTLPTLPHSELQQVALRLQALTSSSLSIPPPIPDCPDPNPNDYLLEGIHYELRRRGLIGTRQRIPERSFPKGYVALSHSVRQNLHEHLPALTRAERIALGQLAARCLADFMELRHTPLCPKSMLQQVSNIPAALDWAFPGYLCAGLLAAVLPLR